MSVWEELFDGTDVKDGVADAIRSSISEKQAAILAKELDIASRWALFKLGYKGVEVGEFWAKRTDQQIQALAEFVNDFGDPQLCNAEISRRKREGNLTSKQLFENLVDTDPLPKFSGDAVTDPRLAPLRKESIELRKQLTEAIALGNLQVAMDLQSREWPNLARRIAEVTKEHGLRPIEGAIFEPEA